MKNARAKRAKILFFIAKYANLWGFCCRRRRGCLSSLVGSSRSYDGNCKENITLKLNLALSWVSCDYSTLITLYKIGGVHFRLLGTNGFHVKAKNERFTTASSRCRQNLKYENFTSSFGRLRQNIAPKSVPHVQHDYFFSFNQSNHWFVASSLTLQSSNLKLPNDRLWTTIACHLVMTQVASTNWALLVITIKAAITWHT